MIKKELGDISNKDLASWGWII